MWAYAWAMCMGSTQTTISALHYIGYVCSIAKMYGFVLTTCVCARFYNEKWLRGMYQAFYIPFFGWLLNIRVFLWSYASSLKVIWWGHMITAGERGGMEERRWKLVELPNSWLCRFVYFYSIHALAIQECWRSSKTYTRILYNMIA